MSDDRSEKTARRVEHYDVHYAHFADRLYREIRTETHGDDIGQDGWLTAEEQDIFLSWLELGPGSNLLDVACGSGGPALRVVEKTGCTVHGIDLHEQALDHARRLASQKGLAESATFERLDGAGRLPFADGSFDAVFCIDAVNHLPGRRQVFSEWARIVRPGGSVLFTDPIVVTGPLTHEEIAVRASIGFFVFVPPDSDDALLRQVGLDVVRREDRTENMATIAARWRAARQTRERELRRLEGDDTFEGQQEFFDVAARTAREGRLSRFAYLAVKPG